MAVSAYVHDLPFPGACVIHLLCASDASSNVLDQEQLLVVHGREDI